jgi:hypothetical protein
MRLPFAAGPAPPRDESFTALEAEIRQFQRTNRLTALVMLLAIAAASAAVAYRFLASAQQALRIPPPSYLAVGKTIAARAVVYEQPLPTAAPLAALPRGAVVFVLADKPRDWRKVRVATFEARQQTVVDGWLRREDLRTPADFREAAGPLNKDAERTVKVVDVAWTLDPDGRYAVSGRVVSLIDQPLRNVKVIATFYDDKNEAIDQRSVYVAVTEPLRRHSPQSFVLTGHGSPTTRSVLCHADYRAGEE